MAGANSLVICLSLIFTAFVDAGFDKIAAGLEELANRSNATGALPRGMASAGDLRAFAGFISSYLETINGYGCWCYLDDDWSDHAHGPVQNEVDQDCKNLIQGYQCILHDAQERGDFECAGDQISYIEYNFFGSARPIEEECNENNDNECARQACIVEGTFTKAFFPRFMGSVPLNLNYLHTTKGGDFDADLECRISWTAQNVVSMSRKASSKTECCGDYPSRFPYKTSGGLRGCCAGETYTTMNHDCCDDSILADVGSCV